MGLTNASNLSTTCRKHPIPPQIFTLGDEKIEMIFLPDDKHAAHQLIEMIGSAQKTIRVAMYTFTRKDFAEALARAKERGVDVEITLDKSTSEGASREVVNYLMKRGITPKISNGEHLMHNKMMWIDRKDLAQGSANWTKQAFTQNEDSIMILYNLTEQQNKTLENMWRSLVQ
jgi:phosphatidylserine/phosphatidylglycerophosphate/cardiolipin synthase-like enzyme